MKSSQSAIWCVTIGVGDLHAVRNEEHAASGKIIRDESRERRKQNDRNRGGCAKKADVERRGFRVSRELHDHETFGRQLHPRTEIGDEQSDPEQTKIAELER
jgi:hypothetical protein